MGENIDLALRDSLADTLMWHPWGYFGTMTFKQITRSPTTALNRFYRFMHDLRREANSKSVNFFVGVERHKTGYLHDHFLIERIEGVDRHIIKQRLDEKFGFSQVSDYDGKRGALYYVTKYCVKGFCEYDLWIKKKGQ